MEARKLNPVFSDLEPESLINHVENLKRVTAVEKEIKKNPFPVEVFPKAVQEIITATNRSLNYPTDFIGASMLYAVSVAVGNTHKIHNGVFEQTAVLYLSIVGRAGTNKSHPLTFALKPIEERDKQRFKGYQELKQEYDLVSSLNKKEREAQGYDEPVQPIWEQHLITDFTPEALTDVHKFNKRGIGVYADELASWFKNFNRYNKGSEEQFWLSVWSGKPLRINRKTSEPIYIPEPFISVAGTIQPGVLNELAKDRTENGFLDRILFVIPDDLKKEYWSENQLDEVIIQNWNAVINNLLDLDLEQDENLNPKPTVLKFTPEAKQLLFEWQKTVTDLSNKADNEALSGIYAKFEQYALRLALNLELLRYACGESNKQAVTVEAVKGALKLVEYFKNSALKVHTILTNTSPVDKLPGDKKNLYNALPEEFTTSEGLELANDFGIAERTYKRLLANRELFNNHKRGEYEKRF
ncbi:DUF3987 domain-containing protein [Salinimicrobium sp. 3283s]|uniref:DUF3987 domain-containing protein n=1 Tax=Salinimicrobium sp. 3283s TaxID=3114359 RepID=UPI0031ED8DA5